MSKYFYHQPNEAYPANCYNNDICLGLQDYHITRYSTVLLLYEDNLIPKWLLRSF